MDISSGEHQSRKLNNGIQAYFIRYPGSDKWHIQTFELSWVTGRIGENMMLWTKRWLADRLGWNAFEFETPEGAGLFIEKNITKKSATHW